jgi:uncharacterized peroxidase-related enzyme
LVDAIATDWRAAPLERLSPRARALCEHAEKLTLAPASIAAADIDTLRRSGCSDTAVVELTQVVGLFAYYNRIADGLGIDPEPDW